PRPRSLPGWASPRAACQPSSTPSRAPPNCAPWPPTSKPSAAAWRSSPTSATNGSPSSNPAPKQADLSAPVAYHELRGQGEPGTPPRHLRTGFCLLRGCGQPVSIVVLLTVHSTRVSTQPLC